MTTVRTPVMMAMTQLEAVRSGWAGGGVRSARELGESPGRQPPPRVIDVVAATARWSRLSLAARYSSSRRVIISSRFW